MPTLNDSPVPGWLERQQARLHNTLEEMAGRARMSVDALSRLRRGATVPRLSTLRRMISTLGEGNPEEAEALIAWASKHIVERGLRRRAEQAECRKCGDRTLASQVRGSSTFREAPPEAGASFVHRRCRPTRASGSWFGDWLQRTKGQSGRSWGELRAEVDADLERLRSGRSLPTPEVAGMLVAALQVAPEDADQIVARVRLDFEARRRSRLRRKIGQGRRASCRGGCGRSIWASVARARGTFTPAANGQPATYLCRDCRGQSAKVIMKCPAWKRPSSRRCVKPLRRDYKSAAWKESHRKQLQDDGSYAIPCKAHKGHGTDGIKRLRGVLRDRFVRLYRQKRYDAKFAARYRDAERCWQAAEDGDPVARTIKRNLLKDWAKGLVESRSDRRSKKEKGRDERRRGQSISWGQLLGRWADEALRSLREGSEGSGGSDTYALCPLCWLLIQREWVKSGKDGKGPGYWRRRLHDGCWDVWRRSWDYRKELAQRQRAAHRGLPHSQDPIDPPNPDWFGRLPKPWHVTWRVVWFLKRLDGVGPAIIAEESGVSASAVVQGIEDLQRWLPAGGWSKVMLREKSAETLEKLHPTPKDHRVDAKRLEPRVRWLYRWGMAVEAISEHVGCPIEKVRDIVGQVGPSAVAGRPA